MANEITILCRVNIVPGGIPPIIHVKQYDGNGTRKFLFTVDNRDTVWSIPSSITQVVVQGTKSDGKGFSYACTWSGNSVTATITRQMTACPGKVPCDLVFFDADKNRVASATFILDVSKSAVSHFNLTSVDDYQVDMTFETLNDAGYVLFYVPDSWDGVTFNTTGYDITTKELGKEYEYGHLVLTV